MTPPKKIAIVGAGMAAITCAHHLAQAGHHVTVLEKSRGVGGRMATRDTPFGTFDHGAQYFTVRDARFEQALQTNPALCRPWSASSVQLLNAQGQAEESPARVREPHWVPTPGMNALLADWAAPLAHAGHVELQTRVNVIEPDALNKNQWQLRTTGAEDSVHVYSGFDAVVLAIPSPQAQALLATAPQASPLLEKIAPVTVAPCWTLMLAFPQAMQPDLNTLGPQWNAARSSHHRIAWLARENSKPGRGAVERWTVQASADWSQEHINDDAARVQAKLLKAFAEVTGIHAEPAHTELHRWLYAKTVQPLGASHVWDAASGLGICGDWCLGSRVEDAFVSGLELAQAIAKLSNRIG
jgi:predicted NAD/FAD-dependent oxidoreductase